MKGFIVSGAKVRLSKGGLGIVALLALAPFGGARAQDVQDMGKGAACSTAPAALPRELSGWDQRGSLAAGRDPGTAAKLETGAAIDAVLHPTPEVRYALRPEKPGGSVSFGGLYAFNIPETGRYRVALGSAAWIDVIKAGDTTKGLTSIAHGHGPDCSGIRKMVDFALEPGDYLVQISANADAKLPLLVTRLP